MSALLFYCATHYCANAQWAGQNSADAKGENPLGLAFAADWQQRDVHTNLNTSLRVPLSLSQHNKGLRLGGEGELNEAYLHTKAVGIAGSQQPNAVVTQAIEELLEQVGLLLLALLLQHSIAAIWGILQTRQQTSEINENHA